MTPPSRQIYLWPRVTLTSDPKVDFMHYPADHVCQFAS